MVWDCGRMSSRASAFVFARGLALAPIVVPSGVFLVLGNGLGLNGYLVGGVGVLCALLASKLVSWRTRVPLFTVAAAWGLSLGVLTVAEIYWEGEVGIGGGFALFVLLCVIALGTLAALVTPRARSVSEPRGTMGSWPMNPPAR